MTFTYPFAPEFADQFRAFFEAERQNPPSNALPGLKDNHIPTGLLENIRSSQPRETGADYHARISMTLDERTEYEWCAERRDSGTLQETATCDGVNWRGPRPHHTSPVSRSS